MKKKGSKKREYLWHLKCGTHKFGALSSELAAGALILINFPNQKTIDDDSNSDVDDGHP